jgi:two-component system, OmpR family, response regulator TctD
MRVLLVEDNRELAEWIARALRQSSMVVDVLHDGAQAEHLLATQSYDIVLLDLSLPRVDGLTVLRKLRARECAVPVLVLTARGGLEDRVRGLDAGADDYVTKPFELSELEARMRALVRRAHGAASNEVVIGSLHYDAASRLFKLGGDPVALSPREHSVLEMLVGHARTPVSKETLAGSIVALDDAVSVEAIEIYVHRLRRKLEHGRVRIRTLRGLGYMLEADLE